MVFKRRTDTKRTQHDDRAVDLANDHQSDQQIENPSIAGRALIAALDKAASVQTGSIIRYVDYIRAKNPDKSPREIQDVIDKHFRVLATGSGAGAGAAAAIPGIGFFTGAAAIGAESLVFLDAAAWYTLASAYLRGTDLRDPQHRKALILIVLLGTKGSAVVDALIGESGAKAGLPTLSTLTRFSAPKLAEANSLLMRTAMKQISKKLRRAWLGKIMPLGIGAIAGTLANRGLARGVIKNSHEHLGAVPEVFPTALDSADTASIEHEVPQLERD